MYSVNQIAPTEDRDVDIYPLELTEDMMCFDLFLHLIPPVNLLTPHPHPSSSSHLPLDFFGIQTTVQTVRLVMKTYISERNIYINR